MHSLILGLSLLFLIGLTNSVPRQVKLSKHPVLLVVSFDGFRYDYMTKTDTPNLRAMQNEGVTVPHLRPQFPSFTFPNHHSIVTGMYPDTHGVTDNTVFDPLLDKYLNGYDGDPEFWNYHPEVLPFYIRNELAGDDRYSGCYMWAGSSTAYGEDYSLRPTHYIPVYNESIPWEDRVDTVISWMSDDTKPANIVFLYYDEPDSTGHSYGTDDARTIQQIQAADFRTGILVQKLKDAGIYDEISIIILSDHGMQTVTSDKIINTIPIVDQNLYDRLGGSPNYHIRPKNSSDLETIYRAFKAASTTSKFSVYKKEELHHLNYNSNRRIMDILLMSDPGFAFENVVPDPARGVHGYDPNFVNMSALFIARGPLFKSGYKSDLPVNNIDLFSLFSKVMGVPISPNNGTLERVALFLQDEIISTDPPTTGAPTANPGSTDASGGANLVPIHIGFILSLLLAFI